ncbi:urea transporter [Salmonella enterica subsp. enterica serovar Thompson]|nr:urea transporter [Salmonella enterica subsp. enterica]EBR2769130.1 urea transporter [Salmonella enterica]EBV8143584.1 urea transporter [Salmonella enterica subsp. enterica serovar Thompson]EED9464865.1 urea transporter [Salmonella enterica subsp. enterica serovar Abaetetuba]EBT4148422.1 urea transporter [Salmonella enterica subsp. enterica]
MTHKKIKSIFCSYSQITLLENTWSGFLFFIAILISSIEMDNIKIFFYSAFSAILSTSISIFFGYSKEGISKGLFGYNAILYSIALAIFFPLSSRVIILLIVGVISIVVLTPVINSILRNTPILTTPFIIMTWVACKINGYTIDKTPVINDFTSVSISKYSSAFLLNYTEVFLLSSVVGGLFMMLGILLGGKKLFFITCATSALSIIISINDSLSIKQDVLAGLYGYNIILTTIAIYIFRTKKTTIDLLSGFCGILFTLKSTAFLSKFLLTYSIPMLTLPFILGTWIYILIQKMISHSLNRY